MKRPATILVALLAVAAASAAAQERPNVVLIMSDDMGFSDLGCYGGEVRPPVLDGLAEDVHHPVHVPTATGAEQEHGGQQGQGDGDDRGADEVAWR